MVGEEPLASSGVTIGKPATATAAAGELEWVIYPVGPFGPLNQPNELGLYLEGSSGSVWAGVADYGANAWRWYLFDNPGSEMESRQINGDQFWRDSDGMTFIALAVFDGAALEVRKGSLSGRSFGDPAGPITAEFDFSIGPESLPSGQTATVNGVSLEIEPGSAAWDAGTHVLSFNVRLNNVASHATNSIGGVPGYNSVRNPTPKITWYDANGNPISFDDDDGWDPDPVEEGDSTEWATWNFEDTADVDFDFKILVSWHAGHDMILYSSFSEDPEAPDAGVYNTWMIRPDGTGNTKLTDYTEYTTIATCGARNPVWSPNRTMFAVNAYDSVVIFNAEGVSTVVIPKRWYSYSGVNDNPVFSPDGTQLACACRLGPNATEWEIYRFNIDGSNPVELTEYLDAGDDSEVANRHPSWSPDGTKIVYESYESRNWDGYVSDRDVWVMDATDGGNKVNLTNYLSEEGEYLFDGEPCWSPDGSRIVFVSRRHDDHIPSQNSRSYSIYVMDSDGGNVQRVTIQDNDPYFGAGYDDHAPSWSPDGSKIIFSRWGYSESRIYMINPDGTGRTAIVTGVATEPSW